MAIAYKGAGAGAGTETADAALNLVCPATVDANDILIAHVMHTGTATAPTTPSGWTALYGPANVGATATARHWVYGKLAVGDEDGTTVSFGTAGGTDGRAGRIYSFSGYVSGLITDVVPVASFSSIAHDTDPQGPTVTTTVAGALAIACMCQDDNNTEEAIVGMTGGTWGGHLEYTSADLGPAGLVLYLDTCTPTANPGTVTGGQIAAVNDESGTIGFEIRPQVAAQTLAGTAAIATHTVVAQAIVAGVVVLAGSAAAATWALAAQTLVAGAIALSGVAGTAAWTVPAQTLIATEFVRLKGSTFIPAGGTTATTGQLTPPGTKTVLADFEAGTITDDTNPLASFNPTLDKYSEWEICVETVGVSAGDQVEIRLTNDGVELNSYTQTAVWTIGGGTQELAGVAAVSTGTVPAQTLTAGAVALAGDAALSTGTLPAQSLASGMVVLAGDAALSTHTVPAQTLVPGGVVLAGVEATAAWTLPAQALVQVLAGDAAVSTGTLPAQALTLVAVPLTGDAAIATWAVPSQGLSPGLVALAGDAAIAVWTLPAATLTSGEQVLSGAAAAATWALPAQSLGTGSVALSGTVATAAWTVPAQALCFDLDGAVALATWSVTAHELTPPLAVALEATGLEWTYAESDATSFKVYWDTDHGVVAGDYANSYGFGDGDTRSLTLSTILTEAGLYYFRVAAVNATGEGPLSGEVRGTYTPLGVTPHATWAIPAQTLYGGTWAAVGPAAIATFAVPAQSLSPGTVALASAATSATWTVVAQTLNSGYVLTGVAASATWTVPAHSLATGTVGLVGLAAPATFTVPAQALVPGALTLSGAAGIATWAVPSQALSTAATPLSGPVALATWTLLAQSLVPETTALAGAAGVATWTVPAQTLGVGTLGLSGAVAIATWALPGQSLFTGPTSMAGTAAAAAWGLPSQTLYVAGAYPIMNPYIVVYFWKRVA